MEILIIIAAELAAVGAVGSLVGWALLRIAEHGQHFPHSYSTGISHQPTPGESCNSCCGKCAIRGEGA